MSEQERAPASRENAELFVFITLISGARFTQQEQFCAWLDIRVPSKTAFYDAQPFLCEALIIEAQESCARWRALMGRVSAISFDGSWSHRRAALHCFGAFIDPKQKKVVDFEIVELPQGTDDGDFVGTSHAMESEVLRRMGARWTDATNVRYFCHDKDNHAMKILREELRWNLIEKFDRNHIVKTLKIRFEKITWFTPEGQDPRKKPRRVNMLGKLESHLLSWFYVVLRADGLLEEKNAMWLGAFDHYVNPPNAQCFQWKKRSDPHAQELLRLFLTSTLDLIEQADSEISTQLNESLHALKAKLADKNYPWKSSWRARNAVAVLNINEGHEWKLRLYDELGFPPLSAHARRCIARYATQARDSSIRRSDPVYQDTTRRARRERKSAQKQQLAAAQKSGNSLHRQ
jgi:hypothetical protein